MAISLDEYRAHLASDTRRQVTVTTVAVTQADACKLIAEHLDDAARLYAQLGGHITILTNNLIEKLVNEMRGSDRFRRDGAPEDPSLTAARDWLKAAAEGGRLIEKFNEERDW